MLVTSVGHSRQSTRGEGRRGLERRKERDAEAVRPDAAGRKQAGRIPEKLLQAALTLFTRRGYSATTVRELVEAAGVTKPVLYYYFKSKEGLFLELMRTHFNHLEAAVDVPFQATGSIRQRLTDMLLVAFDVVRQDHDFIRLMHAVYYGPPGQAPFFDFDAFHQRYHDLIARLMQEGIGKGEFQEGNARDMAWILLGAVEIAIEDQLSQQAARIDRATLKRLLEMVFNGLAAGNQSKKRMRT